MAGTKSSKNHLPTLWDAVLTLSLPAREQLAILEAAGDNRAVDELALDYDDHCWLLEEAESENGLTQDEIRALRSLDRQLDQMSGEANSANWTVEALWSYDCWREVRKLAASALAMRQIARVKTSRA